MVKVVSLNRSGPILLLVGSVLGLIASFMLSNDAVTLAKNSHAALSCSLNLVVNCSTVAESAQATVFGFPNSFIGLMVMPALITVAVVLLAGVQLPRWFIRALGVGVILGLIFAGWMFFQSFVVIRVLCPWCLTTDVGMILVALGTFRIMVHGGYWPWKSAGAAKLSRQGYDVMLAVAVIVLIALVIIAKFGSALFA